jgi:SagB-type dehydrogenase family enzyme
MLSMSRTISSDFMRGTYYEQLHPSDQQKGKVQPPLELEYDHSLPVTSLPDPGSVTPAHDSLSTVISSRTSVRSFSPDPVQLEHLSYLLWCTQGVKKIIPGHATFRTVPSAGARHALETYLLINNVESLEPGLYRYCAIEHLLVRLPAEITIADDITHACWDQGFIKTCAATFIWTAVPYRMTWRYGDRGYRYLHLDAGHVCQNLYLGAESIGCGTCAVAAFHDQSMNALLQLDGESQFVIYLAAVGRKKPGT